MLSDEINSKFPQLNNKEKFLLLSKDQLVL